MNNYDPELPNKAPMDKKGVFFPVTVLFIFFNPFIFTTRKIVDPEFWRDKKKWKKINV